MNAFSKLKLVSATPERQSVSATRRARLIEKIRDQISAAQASSAGAIHKVARTRRMTDPTTGERKTVEVHRSVRPWWWKTSGGRMMVAIRYGAKQLEIAKGKNAIEVATIEDVISTLEILGQAVDAGELDAHIAQAGEAISESFGRRA